MEFNSYAHSQKKIIQQMFSTKCLVGTRMYRDGQCIHAY